MNLQRYKGYGITLQDIIIIIVLLVLTIDKELLCGKRNGEVIQLFQALLELPAESSLLFIGGTRSLFNLTFLCTPPFMAASFFTHGRHK